MPILTNLKAEIIDFSCSNFWQPMLEAITNSLQANADDIKITLISDDKQDDILDTKIDSFQIEDNGDSFSEQNRDNFVQLKNSKFSQDPNKKGCKGMGRLSYLKVFKSAEITSFTGSEKISFTFSEGFEPSLLDPTRDITEKGTKIIFKSVSENFLKHENGKIKKDAREIINLEQAAGITLNHLLHLLFFKKRAGVKFKITFLSAGLKNHVISSENIPNFQDDKSFTLKDSDGNEYLFTLLYSIIDIQDKKGIIHDYYCANERSVCHFKEKGVVISPVEDKNITLLLVSDFFDKNEVIKTERQDFEIKPKDQTSFVPFNWNDDINPNLKKLIVEVLSKAIPDYQKKKKEQKDAILKKRPYLAKYILDNEMLGILDEKEEIRNAQKSFNKEKSVCLDLIDEGNFLESEQKEHLKEILDTGLSEYMWLRFSRLNDIKKLLKNKESNEQVIHNLFLAKGKTLDEDTLLIEDIHHNNLWLIDERLMSYRYAFSDKKIKEIKATIDENSESATDGHYPDLMIAFDNLFSEASDLKGLAVEIKPFNLDYDGNKKGETQLKDYRLAFLDSDKVKECWCYLITNVDKKFADYLTKVSGYKKIFSLSGEIFFNSDLQTYIMPIETLISECEKRHEVFFKILQNRYSEKL